jgi:hypothetical protein
MPLTYMPLLVPLLVFTLLAVIGVVFVLVVALVHRIDLNRLERAGRVWRTMTGLPVSRRDDPD